MVAQLHKFVFIVYAYNPFLYNWPYVRLLGGKIILLIKDRAGVWQANSLNT